MGRGVAKIFECCADSCGYACCGGLFLRFSY